MLESAGVTVQCIASSVDEAPVKQEARSSGWTAERLALSLAQRKALAIAATRVADIIIGADQVLESGQAWFDKPRSIEEARRQLVDMRGRTHRLVSAVVLARGSQILWQTVEVAALAMRDFTDEFLERYLQAEADQLLHTVGGYHIEGRGSQLMERVSGDHFVILGMPLVPLLAALREFGVCET
jgi:septum formation protein